MAPEPTATLRARLDPAGSSSVASITSGSANPWLHDHRTRPLPRASVREEVDVAVQARTAELEREIAALRQETDELRSVAARAQTALSEASGALTARTAMLGALARELRVPLNAIVGFTHRLASATLTASESELLKNVGHNAEWLVRLVDDLLDFSQVDTGEVTLAPVDFELGAAVQVAADLHADAAARKGLDILIEIDPSVPARVRGDRKRLQQILVKLIGHAVKFTDQRHVTIRAWMELSTSAGSRVRFEIGDAGTTLPVSVHPTLFDPDPAPAASSVHLVGTRLGLAVTKRLVQLMGGRIGMLSRPDSPSTFWFTVEFSPPLDLPASGSRPASITGRHILLVDDNPSNLRLFGRLANVWKLRAGLVDSAGAALAYLQQAAHTHAPVDLVLLDHPSRASDPFALADAIRADPSIPVPAIALLTSDHESLTMAELHRHGISACEAKPLRARTLRAMLTRALPAARCAASAAMPGAA